MIKIYLSKTNTSSKKAIGWLKKHKLEYELVNWASARMTHEEFFKILSLTENGTKDILAQKSSSYNNFSKFMNDLTLVELLGLINCEKDLLRLPLLVDDNHLQVGYNEDSIRQFIPNNVRKFKKEQLLK